MKALFSFIALIIGLGLAIANPSLPPPKQDVIFVSLVNFEPAVQLTASNQITTTQSVFSENAYRVSGRQTNGILGRQGKFNFTPKIYNVFRVGWKNKEAIYICKFITAKAPISNIKADFKVGWQNKAHYNV